MQITAKPTVSLVGQDSNIFHLIGLASKALKKAGLHDKAKEMTSKVFDSESYDEAIRLIANYVEIV